MIYERHVLLPNGTYTTSAPSISPTYTTAAVAYFGSNIDIITDIITVPLLLL